MLRAVFLACGHTCQDTVAKKDGVLLIENLHMLNAYIVQFNVTTAFSFFFHLCQTLDTHETCLWSAQQGTKESFEKLLHEKKRNALTVCGFCFVFCLS